MRLFAAILFLSLSAAAQDFLFSRADYTLWTCAADTPYKAAFEGYGSVVGANAAQYDGSLWWVDSRTDALVRDGALVEYLHWYGGLIWDAQDPHGFAIADGHGWLATQDDQAAESFLLRVDLSNGSIVPLGMLGDVGYLAPVNGLAIVPEPNFDALVLLAAFMASLRK